MEQTAKMSTFLPAMCAAFFMRVRPASRKAKPACMNMTRTAASTTQTVLTAITRSAVFICLDLLASPFENDDVAPYGVQLSEPFLFADDPEAALHVKREARL